MSSPSSSARRARGNGRRILLAGAVFATTWVLWSGMLKPLLLALGLVSVLLVLALARRIGFFDPSLHTLHMLARLPRLWMWLLPEIVKANLAVARIVLTPRLRVSPRIAVVDASGLPPASQAVLANAITLTPGTLTLDVDQGRIEVHCLTEAAARDLASPGLVDRAARLERG